MGVFKNDPFPGTDYTQYLSWKKVTTPDGQVYYVVPSNPGYVYDPVASNATGRKVFRRNPQQQIDAQKQEEDRIKGLQEQEAFNRSPAGQLLPIAGTTGGLILAHEIMKPGAAEAVNQVMLPSGQIVSMNTGANAAAAASGAQAANAGMVTNSALATPEIVGANAVAPEVATPELIGGADVGLAPELGAMNYIGGGLGIGLGGYNAYEGLTKGNPVQAGLGGVGVGLGLNSLGLALGPYGWAAMAALPIAAKLGLFDHESTRERTAKNTQKLMEQGQDDTVYQNYVAGMREQFKEAPKGNPFHGGDYATFDEYKKAGLDPNDLTGVYGNIKTFGPEWAHLSEDQRRAVTQGIIDADLYTTNKGDVEITDPTKAREIKDNVLKGFNVGSNAQAAAQGAVTVAGPNANTNGLVLKRSSTQSPGIGLNGKPIFITR